MAQYTEWWITQPQDAGYGTGARNGHGATAYFRIHPLLLTAFLGFIIYWYLQGGFRWPFLATIRFEFLYGAALGPLAVMAWLHNATREPSGLGKWVASLLVLMAVMVLLSRVPSISWSVFADRVVKFALIGFYIAAFITTPRALAWFVAAFLLACFKMGQEGMLGIVTGSLIWENQGVPRLHGPTPIYAHPNSYAGMALGSIPFIVYFLRIAPRYLKLVLVLQLFMSLSIVIFTGSRAGYVALAIGLLFLAWKARSRKRAIVAVVIGSLLAVPFVPQDYFMRARTIFTQEDIEGASIDTRKQILADAWQVFIDNPLGIGVHAFPAVREERFGRTQDTHNLYLELATNLGIQGLVVFLILVGALLARLTRLVRDIRHQLEQLDIAAAARAPPPDLSVHVRELRIIDAACRAVYVFVVIRLGLGLFGMDLYEIYWWFALGLTVAAWNINAVARRRTERLCALARADDGAVPETRGNFA